MPPGEVKKGIVNPIGVFPGLQTRADGGIMDLQDGGESVRDPEQGPVTQFLQC
jgi:hypothetical protein